MSVSGRPECPVEGCDGNLHREFITGLNRSTAQLLALGGYGLMLVPALLASPFLVRSALQGAVGGFVGAAAVVLVCVVGGVGLLRYRKQRLSERSEQQRCHKCGTVVPA